MPEQPAWYWDAAAARFRSERGRFVAAQVVQRAMERSLEDCQRRAASLGWAVAHKQITPNQFREALRAELKAEHIRQYLVGHGGLQNMTPADWGKIGGRLGKQYRYLDTFVSDLVTKDLSEGQIIARARMYGNAARGAYEGARWEANAASDVTHVLWEVHSTNPCDGCSAFAGLGWQRTADDPYGGQTPGDGQRSCKGNCRCTLRYAIR
jgi:hypothetical protein